MNGEQLRQYQVGVGHRMTEPDFGTFVDEGGRRLVVTDGYEFIAAGRQHKWRALASWGDPGWDLGSWPYVVFMVRGPKIGVEGDDEPGPFEFVVHVEGDLTTYSFPTNALRREALTYLFVWYASRGIWSNDYAKGWDPENPATWPPEVNGPYRFMSNQEA